MEYWDLYDQNRNLLHQIHEKGQPIPYGTYHLIADVWILTLSGKYLISQRTAHKHHGLCWECPGGSVQSGETTAEGAVREVWEELGICLEKEELILIDTCCIPDRFVDTYLVIRDVSMDEIVKQEDEVQDVKLAAIEEIDNHWQEEMFSPRLRYQRYREQLIVYAKEITDGSTMV